MTPWKRKDNLLGLCALAILVLLIVGQQANKYFKLLNAIDNTKKVISTLGNHFISNDKVQINQWAKGEVLDDWGNQIILHRSHQTAVVLVSKGPDGILGTPDDISESFVKPVQIIKKIVQEETKETEEPKKRSWSWKWGWLKK